MCELARTRKSPDRFQTCLCKKTRRNARCQRAFSADQKSSHGFPPRRPAPEPPLPSSLRSAEHTSSFKSLIRNSYAVFCLKKITRRLLRTPDRDEDPQLYLLPHSFEALLRRSLL